MTWRISVQPGSPSSSKMWAGFEPEGEFWRWVYRMTYISPKPVSLHALRTWLNIAAVSRNGRTVLAQSWGMFACLFGSTATMPKTVLSTGNIYEILQLSERRRNDVAQKWDASQSHWQRGSRCEVWKVAPFTQINNRRPSLETHTNSCF